MQGGHGHHGARRPVSPEDFGIDLVESRPVLDTGHIGRHLQNAIQTASAGFGNRDEVSEREPGLALEVKIRPGRSIQGER